MRRYIAQRNNVFVLTRVDITGPAPADAYAGDVELVARSGAIAPAENVRRNDRKCRSHSRGAAHEISPRYGLARLPSRLVLAFHNQHPLIK
jgi:hypothetical protein